MGPCQSKARQQTLYQKHHDINFQSNLNNSSSSIKSRVIKISTDPRGLTQKEFSNFFPRFQPQPEIFKQNLFNHLTNIRFVNARQISEGLMILRNLNETERIQFMWSLYLKEGESQISKDSFISFLKVNIQYLCLNEKEKSDMLTLDNFLDILQVKQFKKQINFVDFSQFVQQRFNLFKFFDSFEIEMNPSQEKELILANQSFLSLEWYNDFIYVISAKWWESWHFYIDFHNGRRLNNYLTNPQNLLVSNSPPIHIQLSPQDISNEDQKEYPDQYEASYHVLGNQDIYDSLEISKSDEYTSSNQSKPLNQNQDNFNSNLFRVYQQDELYEIDEPSPETCVKPSQVDNSDIFGEYEGTIKNNLHVQDDFIILTRDSWLAIQQWYGVASESHILKRPVFRNEKTNELLPKLYPMFFICLKYKHKILNDDVGQTQIDGSLSLKHLTSKLQQDNFLDRKQEYIIYSKGNNRAWSRLGNEAASLEQQEEFKQHNIVLFVEKKMGFEFEKFIVQYGKSGDIFVGDYFNVFDPLNNDWRKGLIFKVNSEGYTIHKVGESYQMDFLVKLEDKEKFIQPLKTNSMQTIRTGQTTYRGLLNLGNTCFMNSILQCLFYTPGLKEQVLNLQFNRSNQNQFIQETINPQSLSSVDYQKSVYLPNKETIQLIHKGSKDQQINVSNSTLATNSKMPKRQIQNKRKFLSSLISTFQDELKSDNSPDFIQDHFIGKTVNLIQCMNCNNMDLKNEEFITLSLPIPDNNSIISIGVISVPSCRKGYIPQLRKYGIQISPRSSLSQLINQIESETELHYSTFELFEVYRNNIIKNYYGIDSNLSIQTVGLKDMDEIYIYQLAKSGNDVDKDYKDQFGLFHNNKFLLQPGAYIDFKEAEGWTMAQIKEIQYRDNQSYFHLKYKTELSKRNCWLQLPVDQIAIFRTKSTVKKSALMINLVNRLYNENSKTMEKFSFPLVLTIPSYLTWKEFHLYVYNQARRFIDFSFFKKKNLNAQQLQRTFSVIKQPDNSMKEEYQSLQLRDTKIRPNYLRKEKGNQKQKQVVFLPNNNDLFNRELEFLRSVNFPYRLRLLNQTTMMCYHCDKSISYNKDDISKCQGCEKGLIDKPLSWYLQKNNVPLIALDWADTLPFNPLSSQCTLSQSYQDFIQKSRSSKEKIQIERCFNLFSQKEENQLDCLQCSKKQQFTTQLKLDFPPKILIIHLKRFTFVNGHLQKIKSFIEAPIKDLNLRQWIHSGQSSYYNLFGVVNHLGSGNSGHYYSVIKDKYSTEWIAFNDEQVQKVQEQNVINEHSYLLFYNQILN